VRQTISMLVLALIGANAPAAAAETVAPIYQYLSAVNEKMQLHYSVLNDKLAESRSANEIVVIRQNMAAALAVGTVIGYLGDLYGLQGMMKDKDDRGHIDAVLGFRRDHIITNCESQAKDLEHSMAHVKTAEISKELSAMRADLVEACARIKKEQ